MLYLVIKINPVDRPNIASTNGESTENIFWTESKNSLIELIYALHVSGAISHGKTGIRKISSVLQVLFQNMLRSIKTWPQPTHAPSRSGLNDNAL